MWFGFRSKIIKLDAESDADADGAPTQNVLLVGPDGSGPVAPPDPVNPPSALPAASRHDKGGKFTSDPGQDTGAGHKGKNQPPVVARSLPAEDDNLAGETG